RKFDGSLMGSVSDVIDAAYGAARDRDAVHDQARGRAGTAGNDKMQIIGVADRGHERVVILERYLERPARSARLAAPDAPAPDLPQAPPSALDEQPMRVFARHAGAREYLSMLRAQHDAHVRLPVDVTAAQRGHHVANRHCEPPGFLTRIVPHED